MWQIWYLREERVTAMSLSLVPKEQNQLIRHIPSSERIFKTPNVIDAKCQKCESFHPNSIVIIINSFYTTRCTWVLFRSLKTTWKPLKNIKTLQNTAPNTTLYSRRTLPKATASHPHQELFCSVSLGRAPGLVRITWLRLKPCSSPCRGLGC